MRIYFGTVIRTAPVAAGGELVCLNWEARRATAGAAVYPSNPDLRCDPNPRGNTRGCRGVAVVDGQVVGASYHSLGIFDLTLAHRRDISHGLMVGLHEIHAHDEHRLWVASTELNAALEVDLRTGELCRDVWPHELPRIARALNVPPLPVDKRGDYRAALFRDVAHIRHPSHLHLNALFVWRDQVFALLNRFNMVVNLTRDEVVLQDPYLDHPHNLLITPEGVAIINNSFRHSICFYDITTGRRKRVIRLRDFAWVRRLRGVAWLTNLSNGLRHLRRVRLAVARPLFVRGLDYAGSHLFVGLSPASILRIDARSGTLIEAYNYSRDVRVCVHGLCVRNGPT
jgi:hypothetical protein